MSLWPFGSPNTESRVLIDCSPLEVFIYYSNLEDKIDYSLFEMRLDCNPLVVLIHCST